MKVTIEISVQRRRMEVWDVAYNVVWWMEAVSKRHSASFFRMFRVASFGIDLPFQLLQRYA